MKTRKTASRLLAWTLTLLLSFGGTFSYALADGIIEGLDQQKEPASMDDILGDTLESPDEIGVIYDPQPETVADVLAVIDAYEAEYRAALEEDGFLAALEVPKPRWQYEVAAELMPQGWHCELVDWDEAFGAEYYTFFSSPAATAYGGGYAVEPPKGYGTDISDYFNIISGSIDSTYSNVAVITKDAQNQYGAMWAVEKLDLTLSFKTEMYLHLGHQDGGSGTVADGMTFTMHNDPKQLRAIGGLGEGLGVYKGRKVSGTGTTADGTFLKNSLVIELDTYRNSTSDSSFVNDPYRSGYNAHCALVIPRSEEITLDDHQNVFYFNTVQDWVKFEVEWKPDGQGGGMLTYSLAGVTNESSQLTTKEYEIEDVNAIFGGTEVYWGFTGTTGGYTALQAAAITRLPLQEILAEKTVEDAAGVSIDEAKVGDTLSYSIKVTVEKTADGIGPVIITDELSQHVKYIGGNVTITTSDGSDFEVEPSFAGNTMTIQTGHYLNKAGDWLTATFDVIVLESGFGEIVANTAVVDAENLTKPQVTNTTEVEIAKISYKVVDESSNAGKDGAPVIVGDEIIYKIYYINNTDDTANLTITDTLPEGLTYVDSSDSGIYDSGTRMVTWAIGGVTAGVSGVVLLTAKVTEEAGAHIKNIADLSWNAAEGTETEDPEVTNPVISYKIVDEIITAGAGGAFVTLDDEIIYKIGYINPTGKEATLTITDELPAGLDYVDSSDSGIYDSGMVIWTISGVPSDGGGYVTLTVKVTKAAGAQIKNIANLSWNAGDGLPETEDPEVVTPVFPYKIVDEESEAGVDGAPVTVGDVVTFRIGYANPGDQSANLTITDTLPEGLEYISNTGGGAHIDNRVEWTISVPAGESGYVTLTAKVTEEADAFITNTALLQWDNGAGQEEPEVTVPVSSYKIVDAGSAGVGGASVTLDDEITYRIRYSNHTGDTATLTITDELPAGLEFVSATKENGDALTGYSSSDRTIIWTIDSVPAGDIGDVTLTVKVTAEAGDLITNKARLEWNNGGGKSEKEEPEAVNPVFPYKVVDVNSIAGVNGAPVAVGDEITYKIGYKNPTDDVAALTITDELPAGLAYIDSTEGGRYVSGIVTWTIGGVQIGESGYVTLTVKVTAETEGFIKNIAKLSWDTGGSTEIQYPEVVNPVAYNVTYNANGGTGSYKDNNLTYDWQYIVRSQSATGITRIGYSFTGWNTAADGNGTSYSANDGIIIKGNVTLYAQWTRNTGGGTIDTITYDVIYHANNSLGEADITYSKHSEGDTIIVQGNLFTVPVGKEFAGWSTNPDGNVEYTEENTFEMPATDVHLYAVWKEKKPGTIFPGIEDYEILDEEIPLGFLDLDDHFAYIIGYPDGNIRPQGEITREEVATIFFRLLTGDVRMEYWSETNSFSDVSPDRWSNNAISTLVNTGILKGYPDGTFRPEAIITRAELAVIAARFNKEATTDIQEFSDISGHWARNYIMRAALRGWVKGYEDGTFRPDTYITRAEVMTLINRVLNRYVETKEDMLEDMIKWPDNIESTWYYLDVQEATNSHFFDREEGSVYETWTGLRLAPDWSILERYGAKPGDIHY